MVLLSLFSVDAVQIAARCCALNPQGADDTCVSSASEKMEQAWKLSDSMKRVVQALLDYSDHLSQRANLLP